MDVWGHRALVCVIVVVGCLLVVGSGAAVTADSHSAESEEAASNDLSEADEIHTTIHIHENRSATVEVDYRYQLNGNNESGVDWDRLAADVESNPDAYIAVENESWQEMVDKAINETDREMELSRFTVTTDNSTRPVELGHVRFQFHWSSFAYGEPRYIEAGDALVGFTLVENTRLTITWPDSYEATELHPEPTSRDNASAHWDGESMFDDPRIELLQTGGGSGAGDNDLGLGISWQMGAVIGALAALLIAAIGVGGWLLSRERRATSGGPDPNQKSGSRSGERVDPPSELLSNEEQVLRLLERRGGRLKQQQVVAELDWTEAKTSQVVTGLREAGEIDVFRIGRENVLVLAEGESP